MFDIKKILKFLVIFLAFSLSKNFSFADPVSDIGNFLKDTFTGLEKSFFRSSDVLEKEINSTIERINKECCDSKFEKKNELLELKNSIEKSYKEKNHEYSITHLDFRKSKKYLLQLDLENAQKLLLENTKTRLLTAQDENKKIQSSKMSLEEKLKSSLDTNKKLQNEIEQIIKNYDAKIEQLEIQNKTLKEDILKLEKTIKESAKKNSWWK